MILRIKIEGVLYKPKEGSSIEWDEHKIAFDVDDIEDIRISVDRTIVDWVKDPSNTSVVLVNIPSVYISEKHIVEITIIKLTGDLVTYDAYLENTIYVDDISYHNYFVVFGYDLGNNDIDITHNVPFVVSLYLNSPSVDNSTDNSTDSQPRLYTDFIQYREPFSNILHTYYSVGGVNQPTSREWEYSEEEVLEIDNALFLDNFIGEITLKETSSLPLPHGASAYSFPFVEVTEKTKQAVPLIFSNYNIESIVARRKKICASSCDCEETVICEEPNEVYTLISTATTNVYVDDVKTPLVAKRVLDRGIYNTSGNPIVHEQISIEEQIWLGQLHKLSFKPNKEAEEYLFRNILVFYDKDKPVITLKSSKILKTACIAEINRVNHKEWRLENNTVRNVNYSISKLEKDKYVFISSGILKEVECKFISFSKDGVYKVTFTQDNIALDYCFVVDTKLQECLVDNITDLITETCFTKQDLLLLSTLFWLSILFYHKTLQFENNKAIFPILYEQDKLVAIELNEILDALSIYCRSCKFETTCCD